MADDSSVTREPIGEWRGYSPPHEYTDEQFYQLVHAKLLQQIEAGYPTLLNGSQALRAHAAALSPPQTPDTWANGRETDIEISLEDYLDAHLKNQDPFVVLDMQVAAVNEWRRYVSAILHFLVPEVIGINYHNYLTRSEPMVQEIARYPEAVRRVKECLPARQVVADSYEDAELLVGLRLSRSNDRQSNERVTNTVNRAVKAIFFDMSDASEGMYETHIAFLLGRTLDGLDRQFYSAMCDANDVLLSIPPEKRTTRRRYAAVKFAVIKSVELLHVAVYCLSMHLMDDRAEGGGHYLEPGRFGRTRDWTDQTRVPHGQWPVPEQRVQPVQQRAQEGDRSTTPPPTRVDLSRPPRTTRQRFVRNARENIAPVGVRRKLDYTKTEEDSLQ
jgi:hypothetical protein